MNKQQRTGRKKLISPMFLYSRHEKSPSLTSTKSLGTQSFVMSQRVPIPQVGEKTTTCQHSEKKKNCFKKIPTCEQCERTHFSPGSSSRGFKQEGSKREVTFSEYLESLSVNKSIRKTQHRPVMPQASQNKSIFGV